MEHHCSLTIETFLAVAEMIAAQLRIKEADRWTATICQLKYVSFKGDFPEVSDNQFMWAAERWSQSTGGRDFVRYPTWRELMAPLYRTENGLANRSWGFREDLPAVVMPTAAQLQQLPSRPTSIALPPDALNTEAYLPFSTDQFPALPPAAGTGPTLTPEQWEEYLNSLTEREHATAD